MIFTKLPDDNFGLYVENEEDKLKILWVVNEIGEKKLRASSMKRSKYFPDSPLFISTIIKRFRLKVPRSAYSKMPIKIYRVYVLATKDKTRIKIGMTGRWPSRAFDFVKSANYKLDFGQELNNMFDSDLSFAFNCKDKPDSRAIEKELKQRYKGFQTDPPEWISYGNRCTTEWFSFLAYENIIANFDYGPKKYTLKESLKWNSS